MQWGAWQFANPEWLWALLAIPVFFWLRRFRQVAAWVVPFASRWHGGAMLSKSAWTQVMMTLGAILLILALCRPQIVEQRRETQVRGYDLMLVLDLSGSMLFVDGWNNNPRLQANRLQVIKPVIEAFINERPNDRIGVVIFAGEAYTLSPLTFDHDWLRKQLGRMEVGLVGSTSTAVGDALALALGRLNQDQRTVDGQRQGAFVILLTDGESNAGLLEPREAAEIAVKRGIPVFPIAAGTDQFWAPDPRGARYGYMRQQSRMDFSALEEIAEMTDGIYLRAKNKESIAQAFEAINRTQRIEFDSLDYRLTEERFSWLAVPSILCFLSSLVQPALLFSKPQEVMA
ncbi:MAG: VWA domain-containing protein [Verrucomicrobiota bacterium]